MADQHYDLFFRGDLAEGGDVTSAKNAIQALFKANDAYIEKLFSGQEQQIKKQIDKATAIKFQQAFKKAGAKLIVRPHKAVSTQASASPKAPIPKAPIPKASSAKSTTPATPLQTAPPAAPVVKKNTPAAATIDSISADTLATLPNDVPTPILSSDSEFIEHHQANIQAPSAIPAWDISAPGAQLGESKEFVPAAIDTSDLSVAAAGEDLVKKDPFEAPTPVINTDSLSLASAGSDLETLIDEKAPVVVDISHLQVEEPKA